MKSQTIKLHSTKQIKHAVELMDETLELDDLWCVEIKKYKEAKTLQQLRALFGTWYDYLSNELGETKDDLHARHKDDYLRLIYIENPQGELQQMWVELLDEYLQAGDVNKVMKHLGRISLSWATIDQMREYMQRIEHYYLSNGYPLPVLEKFKRWYV